MKRPNWGMRFRGWVLGGVCLAITLTPSAARATWLAAPEDATLLNLDTSTWSTPAPTTSRWIRTDQSDYLPGDIVSIASGGWEAGESVSLVMAETGPQDIHPLQAIEVVADAAGMVHAGYVIQDHDLGQSFLLTATAVSDPARTAQTTFTDGVNSIHICVVTTSGGVKCWGRNTRGQLGNGTTLIFENIPVDVVGLTSGVVQVRTGSEHSCALMASGGVKCWGRNLGGRLGDGTTIDRSTPVDVVGLSSGVIQLTAGDSFTCALMASGGVQCWGSNLSGALGDGTFVSRGTPGPVLGLPGAVKQIGAGNGHVCAVSVSGGVTCWGNNAFGQLGNGTALNQSAVPVSVSGLTGAAQVSGGTNYTCAVTTSGGAKCWGANGQGVGEGRLGDGTNTNRTTPVDVVGLTSGVAQIACGNDATCALTTAGGAKCWGINIGGAVGTGTNVQNYLTPVDVVGLTSGVAQVCGSQSNSYALTTGGGVKAWGFNTAGQLGDGSFVPSSRSPVDVFGLTSGVALLPESEAFVFTDEDEDGVGDIDDNCPSTANPDQTDTDQDGTGDACDPDDDGDTVPDGADNCQFSPNVDQADLDNDGRGDPCDTDADVDGDGVCTSPEHQVGCLGGPDNCPTHANEFQTDTDHDGDGDECDDDDDNDGVCDGGEAIAGVCIAGPDNCTTLSNPDQADSPDGDGIGDPCDADDDNDGTNDAQDNCPLTANSDQNDTDGDGAGDVCDLDDDNDLVPDTGDNCPFVANGGQADTDGDGIGDACNAADDRDGDEWSDVLDNCPDAPNSGQGDLDQDGTGDACDPDIDGDGVANGSDVCAGTPGGQTVDPSNGCTIVQLCPCEGPRGTNQPWSNHGKYLWCLARATNDFSTAGLLAPQQKDEIVVAAGHSECGR